MKFINFYKDWYAKVIYYIDDLLKDSYLPLGYQECKQTYNI